VDSPSEPAAVSGDRRKRRFWQVLGPGLITGAADDDPSGIATYAQAGAQFGFALGWTLVVSYPMMVAVQMICARIGRTTGHGIAGNLRRHYPNWILQLMVTMLCIANILNIGADLGAMAASTALLMPLPAWISVIGFGLICSAGPVFLRHTRYVSVLKWLTLSLLAYFGTAAVVHVPWDAFLTGLLWPHFTLERRFWLTVVAILGTTISPYLFFWQASQEVEDTKARSTREPLLKQPEQGPRALNRIKIDTLIGMAASNLVGLAILVTAAATLYANGVHDVNSAAQAAEALRPLAGNAAFVLFALGIIGTGLLSVPVLAGSAAYALGEARKWPVGLSRAPQDAKAFYAAIAIATFLGALGNVFGVNPVKALVWAAVLNGIVAVPVMALLMLMSVRTAVLGEFCISRSWVALGWIATAVMAAASVVFILTSVKGT
jgi:NRAMP (natural resistance-associated macrophage protein)-like metal ion transporter